MTEQTVTQALSAVMDDVRSVRKSDRNEKQKFMFRGIDAVLNAVGPALRTHGVVVVPQVTDHTVGTVEVGVDRRPMTHALVEVTYRFHGPAGDSIDTSVLGEAFDAGDKAVAKAMSVAFRTCLLQALCLPTDEPDPDEANYERATPFRQPEPQGADPWQLPPEPPVVIPPGEGSRGRTLDEAMNRQRGTATAQPASEKQIRYIGVLMSEREMKDHEKALAFVNRTIAPDAPIQSRNDLSKAQASKIVEALMLIPIPMPAGELQD